MLKRTLIVLTMTIALVVAIEPVQTVHGVILSAEEIASLEAANSPARNSQTAGGGSSFVRALKAPFKAIGRLFGRGKKDDTKLQRISEKDMKRFESAAAKQTSVSNVPQTNSAATPPSNAASQPVNQSGEQLNQQLTNPRLINQNSTQTTNLQAMAIEHLEKGRDFLNKGNLNEAIEELSKAASLDHTLAEARTLLGVAYEGKGLHDAAMKSFEAAVEAQNNNPQHLNNLGYALYSTGDY